jgi:hypothetical protein
VFRPIVYCALLCRVAGGCATTASLSPVTFAVDEAPRPASTVEPLDLQHAVRALRDAGTWRVDAHYGRLWTPHVAQDPSFTPYVSRGRWRLAREGLYWSSVDDWGAITFHFGRWVFADRRWSWAPGTRCSPAWVSWRGGAGWIGWSPLPPEGSALHAPFAYLPHDALHDAAPAARVVTGAAAVSLFARTRPIETTMAFSHDASSVPTLCGDARRTLAAPSLVDTWLAALPEVPTVNEPDAAPPPDAFTSMSPGTVVVARARQLAPTLPLEDYAPVHRPPPADAVAPGIAWRMTGPVVVGVRGGAGTGVSPWVAPIVERGLGTFAPTAIGVAPGGAAAATPTAVSTGSLLSQ